MGPLQSKPWAAKIALLLFVSLSLIGISIGIGVASVRDRRWAELEARVEELRAGTDRPAPERLTFDRALQPGNAWDDYLRAHPWRPGQPPVNMGGKEIRHFLDRTKEADRAAVESLVARFSGSIDLLSSGARRRDAVFPRRQLPRGAGQANVDLVWLFTAKARLLADSGKISEALELLADVCIFGWDVAQSRLGRDGSSGLSSMMAAFRGMRDMLQCFEIGEADLLKLEDRLRQLDDRFPDTSSDLRNTLMELGLYLIQEERDGIRTYYNGQERPRRSWRSLYSSRLHAASTFSNADDLVSRVLDARRLPYEEEYLVSQQVYRELNQSEDRLLRNLNGILDNQTVTRTRAMIRLLKLAAHYRATGEILELDDPFGGKIRHLFTEKTLLVWHHSIDGRDWQAKPGSSDYSYSLTIEVPRRPGK